MYAEKWKDRKFMIQTKNPEKFLNWIFPLNMILATTIETNETSFGPGKYSFYSQISKAPYPEKRFEAMRKLEHPWKVVTMEPVLKFNSKVMFDWIDHIGPNDVRIGYDSKPEKNHLPEPPLWQVKEFISSLRDAGITVIEKNIRKSWQER